MLELYAIEEIGIMTYSTMVEECAGNVDMNVARENMNMWNSFESFREATYRATCGTNRIAEELVGSRPLARHDEIPYGEPENNQNLS